MSKNSITESIDINSDFIRSLRYKQTRILENPFKRKYLIFQSQSGIILLEIIKENTKLRTFHKLGCFYLIETIKNFKNINNEVFFKTKNIPKYSDLEGIILPRGCLKILQKEKGLIKFIQYLKNPKRHNNYNLFFDFLCTELFLKKIISKNETFSLYVKNDQNINTIRLLKFNTKMERQTFSLSEKGENLLKKAAYFKTFLIPYKYDENLNLKSDFYEKNYIPQYHKIVQYNTKNFELLNL